MQAAKIIVALIGISTSTTSFAQDLPKGEYLARAGNCVVCHSTPDTQPFAGGLKMATPVGNIFSTNITPDRETGIGSYTLVDFDNAVRKGIAKDGHRLYPAMPYPSYAKISDDDIKTLYEYFMREVKAVVQPNHSNDLSWPWNMRWPLSIWTSLMTDRGPYKPDAKADAEWNRGAYLVQGLGHCGACHTPRGLAFQEKALNEGQANYLAGAKLDNWFASNLTGDTISGIGRWSEKDVATFLKTGRNKHGAAFGTMTEVVNYSTQYLNEADLNAIAKYLKSLVPVAAVASPDTRGGKAGDVRAGGVIYARQCEGCHTRDGAGHPPYLPSLAGNPVLAEPDAASKINLILNGSSRIIANGVPDIYRMPPFRHLMTDQDVADVVTFIRSKWGNPSDAVVVQDVADIRKTTDSTSDRAIVLRMR
ncbi:MAG: cytochrome c [Alphaproteobacteria bacterium]|nr:cytochrome c [Alphaproteobacteria bacterium]